MRNDNNSFKKANNLTSKSPRITIRIAFDDAESDLVYLTSHTDSATPGGATVISGVIQNISSTTQTIDHERAIAQIGSLSFDFVDITSQLTTLIKQKLDSNKGLYKKVIRAYVGEADYYDIISNTTINLPFTDYVNVASQLITDISYENGVYTFKSNDIQRETKKEIFNPKFSTLTATVSQTDNIISVASTDGFSLVYQPLGSTISPGNSIGFVQIDNEIISFTGKTSTTLTGCTRGLFNSGAIEHVADLTLEQSRRKKVSEYIYLEGNVILLLYAVLTGKFYGTANSIPSHWSLGISESFIDSTDFVNIGLDYFNQSNHAEGILFRFEDMKKIDGKTFIEKEILTPLNVFLPIYGDGQMGLKRFTKILTNSSYLFEFNEDNIIDYSDLDYNLSGIYNQFIINWNYSTTTKDYRLINTFTDSDSVSIYNVTNNKDLTFRGISASLSSDELVKNIFLNLRDRLAYPPLYLSIQVPMRYNVLEVGDVINVKLPQIRDPSMGTTLDRTFEISNISINWITGDVNLELYSTTVRNALLSLEGLTTVIPDSFYTSAGTDITTVLTTSSTGTTTTVTASGTLTGNDDGSLAIYYCNKNLVINPSVVVSFNKNIRLYVKGSVQIDGSLESTGSGLAVGTGATAYVGSTNNNTAGATSYFGTTSAQDATAIINVNGVRAAGNSKPVAISAVGKVQQMEEFNVMWDGTTLIGLPTDLRGTSGCGGGGVISNGPTFSANGGNGGQGGAGLVIVSRGVSFGANGYIDTSGETGAQGISYLAYGLTAYGGAGGGGAPGCLLIVVDGTTASSPIITPNDTYLSKFGATPYQGTPLTEDNVYPAPTDPYSAHWIGTGADVANKDTFQVIRLNTVATNQQNQTDSTTSQTYASDVTSLTLTTKVNSLNTTSSQFSSIEVTVVPPSDINFSHAFIYYRIDGQNGWIPSGIANNEWVITPLPADGTTYNVQARSVSTSGLESLSGPIANITVLDLENDDLSTVLAAPNITGLEIHGQANDNEFTGRECWIEWNRVAITAPQIGNEFPSQGADSGQEDVYFDYYEVKIYNTSNVLLRTEKTKDNFFIYTWEKNRDDYLRTELVTGAYREFTFEVVVVTKQNQRSPTPKKLSVINPAPVISTISTVSLFKSISVDFTVNDDADYSHTNIYVSETNGFTPGPSTLVTTLHGRTDFFNVDKTAAGTAFVSNTTYYIRLVPYDLFGNSGTATTQQTFTTTQLVNVDYEDLSIGNAKINDLAVDKLTAGTLSANVTQTGQLTISTNGHIKSGQTAYNTNVGYYLDYNSGSPRLSLGDPNGNRLLWNGSSIDIVGNLFQGKTTFASTIAGYFLGDTNKFHIGDATTSLKFETSTGVVLKGNLLQGKVSFADTTAGYFLGDTNKFHIGNSTNYLKFDGTNVDIKGNLAADTVTTASIQGGAVTNLVTAFTAGDFSITGQSTSFETPVSATYDFQSVAITTTTSTKILLNLHFIIKAITTDQNFFFRIMRGSTEIYICDVSNPVEVMGNRSVPVNITYLDDPGTTGSYTYYAQIGKGGNTTCYVLNRFFSALELKK